MVATAREDDPLEKLLGTGVAPALAVNGAEPQRRSILGHARGRQPVAVVGGAAVHLARREVNEPLIPRRAKLHERYEVGVARVDDLQRARIVERRVAERGQGQDDVATLDELLEQPRPVDAGLDATDAPVGGPQLGERHVDRVDHAAACRERRREVRADEATGPEDRDPLEFRATGVSFRAHAERAVVDFARRLVRRPIDVLHPSALRSLQRERQARHRPTERHRERLAERQPARPAMSRASSRTPSARAVTSSSFSMSFSVSVRSSWPLGCQRAATRLTPGTACLSCSRHRSVFDRQISTLDVTEITQFLTEGLWVVGSHGRVVHRQIAYSSDLGRLLGPCCDRRGEGPSQ